MTGLGLSYSKLTGIIAILMLLGGGGWLFLDNYQPKRSVYVDQQGFQATIADETGERTRGLSGRQQLEEDEGMLFVFDDGANTCIWMKDMHFAIDILWFDAAGNMIDSAENVSPDTFPDSFCPDSQAKYVLELPAGSIEKFEFSPGSKLKQ